MTYGVNPSEKHSPHEVISGGGIQILDTNLRMVQDRWKKNRYEGTSYLVKAQKAITCHTDNKHNTALLVDKCSYDAFSNKLSKRDES